jgi:hypothetical protein
MVPQAVLQLLGEAVGVNVFCVHTPVSTPTRR